MPNFEAVMKRSKKKKSEAESAAEGPKAKKAKIDIPDDDEESSEDDNEEGKTLQVNNYLFNTMSEKTMKSVLSTMI